MPVTRSIKGKARDVVDIKARPKKSEKKHVPPSPPPPSTPPLPVEILRNILKYTGMSTLSRCMRASKVFYSIAGPLLYGNIVIDDDHYLSAILRGHEVIDRVRTRHSSGGSNLKLRLLSQVQQVTLLPHFCLPLDPPAFSMCNLQTLLIIPRATCEVTSPICWSLDNCSILAHTRPQKVVVHHTRLSEYGGDDYLAQQAYLAMKSPTLTLVLDEMGCSEAELDEESSYGGVDLESLKELRLVVHQTPTWLDEVVQRKRCTLPQPAHGSIKNIAKRMVAPVLVPFAEYDSISITIYIFAQLDANSLNQMSSAIDLELGKQRATAGKKPKVYREGRPAYTIKTLHDYISEGLEDELLPVELGYWREENQKRRAKAEEGSAQAESST